MTPFNYSPIIHYHHPLRKLDNTLKKCYYAISTIFLVGNPIMGEGSLKIHSRSLGLPGTDNSRSLWTGKIKHRRCYYVMELLY